jgi:hypothetical protein
MRSSTAMSLWTLSTLLVVSGCNDTPEPTGIDSPVPGTGHQVTAATVAEAEVIQLGDFALYLPPDTRAPRGIIVALGGPNTRAFVTGEPFGAPFPETEAALQAMGESLRDLAAKCRMAILGTSLSGMEEGSGSDQLILDAISDGAVATGRAELTTVPILFYGISGGAPEASGFTARHPSRVAGLFLKVPAGVAELTTSTQQEVPTFMVLAELDAFVDNTGLAAAFASNREGGALWALAMEPGVPHHSLSPAQRQLTLDWMDSVLRLRLAGSSGHLRTIVEQSGWLGDPSTADVSAWGGYRGDHSAASWFPTRGVAQLWRTLIGIAP